MKDVLFDNCDVELCDTCEAIVEGIDRDVVYNAVVSYNLIWSVVP